jgi:hypothetical protein
MESIIVVGSTAFALAFVIAWWSKPELRAWLERPKHVFLTGVERYDRSAVENHSGDGSASQ